MFKNAIYCPSFFFLNFVKVRLLLCKGTLNLYSLKVKRYSCDLIKILNLGIEWINLQSWRTDNENAVSKNGSIRKIKGVDVVCDDVKWYAVCSAARKDNEWSIQGRGKDSIHSK